jgi:hypothetical protein
MMHILAFFSSFSFFFGILRNKKFKKNKNKKQQTNIYKLALFYT